ncbi:MAG: FkbM family methyltransferase [Pyrinomonadaceae bacterium]|nr:FkbM family methyltransferase [Pyrinomonadaceae bacterium]
MASRSDWVIYNDIFVDGEYDVSIQEAVRSARMDGSITVLDLGANVGFFTLRFLDLLRQSEQANCPCRVTLVEGSPKIVKELSSRLLGDNEMMGKVRIVHGLVGERHGEARISERDFHAMNSIYFDQSAETVSVDFVNLDTLFQPGEVIDLLKCDIEGAELCFIENYRDLLRRSKAAVFELHHDKCDTERCMKILRDLGFIDQRVLRVTPTFSVCHFSRQPLERG